MAITLVTVFLSAIPAMAHNSLDKIIEPLKDGDKGSAVMYREKRDPETRVLVESSMYVEFSDTKIANKLISAMKKERENAADFSSYSDKSEQNHRIIFSNDSGYTSEYNLYFKHSKWYLTVKKYRYKSKSKTGTYRRR